MPFTKHEGRTGIKRGRRSVINYGASHNENTQYLKDTLFPMKSQGIVGAKLNGIIEF
jgi:hypothetical protein